MENIVIKFTPDTKGLDQIIDQLELLGAVDKKVVDQFKAMNVEFAKSNTSMDALAKETKSTG
jgi:hypothetical protein